MRITAAFNAVAAALPSAPPAPAPPAGFDMVKILGVIAAILAVLIGWSAIKSQAKHGKGDMKGAANSAGVSTITIVQFAIAASFAVMAGWATGILNFFVA